MGGKRLKIESLENTSDHFWIFSWENFPAAKTTVFVSSVSKCLKWVSWGIVNHGELHYTWALCQVSSLETTLPEGTCNASQQTDAQQGLVERLGVWALQLVNGDGPLRCCGWWTIPQTGTRSTEPGIDMNCTACPESIPNESNQARFDPCLMNILSEHGKSCRSHSDRWCFKRFFVKCSEEFRWPMSWYL